MTDVAQTARRELSDYDDGSPSSQQAGTIRNTFAFGGPRLQSKEPSAAVIQSQAESGADVIDDDLDVDPRRVVPSGLESAKTAVSKSLLSNTLCKEILGALKIAGARNAKLPTKLEIIATKLTQRRFCLHDSLSLVDFRRCGGEREPPAILECVKLTIVKVVKLTNGDELVQWIKGDCSVFEDGCVKVGHPPFVNRDVSVCPREPDFEAREYCRLLHVLADPRMTVARTQLMEPRTREEPDTTLVDPWTKHIAPLYNDYSFRPEPIDTLSRGVTASDIEGIDPTEYLHYIDGGILKRRFAQFKSMYGTCMCKYEASGNGDSESFVHYSSGKSYVLYAHCFLKRYPLLAPLATRAMQSDAQREEGVGTGVRPNEESSPPTKKHKNWRQEISIVGTEALSSALKPLDAETARQTEEAERDKSRFEASDERGKSVQSLLSAIKQTKDMLLMADDDTEKQTYNEFLNSLYDSI